MQYKASSFQFSYVSIVKYLYQRHISIQVCKYRVSKQKGEPNSIQLVDGISAEASWLGSAGF